MLELWKIDRKSMRERQRERERETERVVAHINSSMVYTVVEINRA